MKELSRDLRSNHVEAVPLRQSRLDAPDLSDTTKMSAENRKASRSTYTFLCSCVVLLRGSPRFPGRAARTSDPYIYDPFILLPREDMQLPATAAKHRTYSTASNPSALRSRANLDDCCPLLCVSDFQFLPVPDVNQSAEEAAKFNRYQDVLKLEF